MNKDVKKKWVDALRSGRFKQGRSRLNYANESYCCLGVLCEIAVSEGATDPARLKDGVGRSMTYGWSSTVPPDDVLEWAGIDDEPVFPARDDSMHNTWSAANKLIDLNDDQRAPFEVIADWIEANL